MEAAARAGRLRVLVAQWTRIREVFSAAAPERLDPARAREPRELDGAVSSEGCGGGVIHDGAASMRGQPPESESRAPSWGAARARCGRVSSRTPRARPDLLSVQAYWSKFIQQCALRRV